MKIGIGITRECSLRGKVRRYLGAKMFKKTTIGRRNSLRL